MVGMRETEGPSRAPMAHVVAPQTAKETASAGEPKGLSPPSPCGSVACCADRKSEHRILCGWG